MILKCMYKKKITNDEIDLIELFKIIYKQKKKNNYSYSFSGDNIFCS